MKDIDDFGDFFENEYEIVLEIEFSKNCFKELLKKIFENDKNN